MSYPSAWRAQRAASRGPSGASGVLGAARATAAAELAWSLSGGAALETAATAIAIDVGRRLTPLGWARFGAWAAAFYAAVWAGQTLGNMLGAFATARGGICRICAPPPRLTFIGLKHEVIVGNACTAACFTDQGSPPAIVPVTPVQDYRHSIWQAFMAFGGVVELCDLVWTEILPHTQYDQATVPVDVEAPPPPWVWQPRLLSPPIRYEHWPDAGATPVPYALVPMLPDHIPFARSVGYGEADAEEEGGFPGPWIPGMDVDIDVSPVAGSRPVVQSRPVSKPIPRAKPLTRERKKAPPKGVRDLYKAMAANSEAFDFVEQLYRSLPAYVRRNYGTSHAEMLRALRDHGDKIDYRAMIAYLALNTVQDAAYGTAWAALSAMTYGM